MTIFDTTLLLERRNNIAPFVSQHNFLREELCLRTAERFEEIKQIFPVALDLGASLGEMDKYICPKKIPLLLQVDNSLNILQYNPSSNKILAAYNNLPFKENTVDCIIAVCSLAYSNNPKEDIQHLLKVLKSGGLFVLVNPISPTLANVQETLMATEISLFNGAGQRVHPFSDLQTIANTLYSVGFKDVVADADKIQIMYKDPKNIFKDLKYTGNNNILVNRDKKYLGKTFWQTFFENFKTYIDPHSQHYPIDFHYCTVLGWKS